MKIPDSCCDLSTGLGCSQSHSEIEDNKLIHINLKYNGLLMIVKSFVLLVVISITFVADFKIFRNEQQNGTYDHDKFKFYSFCSF